MIAEIATRLRDIPDAFNLVEGAAAFERAAASKPTAMPAAYVLPLREAGGNSSIYSRTRQKVTVTLGIAIAVSNVADTKGAAAQADLTALRDAVLNSLLGWSPAGAEPLNFAEGGLLAFKDGVLWWQDSYRTQHTVSSF